MSELAEKVKLNYSMRDIFLFHVKKRNLTRYNETNLENKCSISK
jgi:hypothetical protein